MIPQYQSLLCKRTYILVLNSFFLEQKTLFFNVEIQILNNEFSHDSEQTSKQNNILLTF